MKHERPLAIDLYCGLGGWTEGLLAAGYYVIGFDIEAAAAIRADATGELLRELNELFDAQFRIHREACEAAGRYIPMVVENVRGAQPWVGRAKWNAGSMYFWGDVPALMPRHRHIKVQSFRFDGSGKSFQSESVRRTDPGKGARFTSRDCGDEARQRWFNDGPRSPDSLASSSSSSPARKAASARIAKIPFEISNWIGRAWLPVSASSPQEAA